MIFVDPEGKGNINVPNIGLAYISVGLQKDHRIIDLCTFPYPRNRFLHYQSDWLGISVKMNNYRNAVRISKLYKRKYPQAKIVWGGPQIPCAYDRIKKENPYVDLFIGEWDYTEDLDSLPFPNYSKFDSYDYLVKQWQSNLRYYPIITSRGCPYSCTFCASHLISGKKWRARSAENCFEELKLVKKRWSINSFQILDDCFNIDKKRVMEFCELIRPLELRWSCANGIRADRFDEDMAKAMKEANCQHVSFGIESIVPEVLEAVKKGETVEQIEKAVDIAKAYFKGVAGFFIIGLPNSSYEKDLYNLHWVMKKGILAHFSYLVPFEGTELYNEADYKGRNFDDALFFGGGAHPISSAYPRHLQKKIYRMTENMRPDVQINPVKRILRRLFKK